MKKTYYFIISGILLALSFPPLPFFFTSFFAFIFLLMGIEAYKEGKIKGIFFRLYLTFFIYNVSSLWWISSFQEQTDPFLMASGFAVDFLHPFMLMFGMFFYIAFFVSGIGIADAAFRIFFLSYLWRICDFSWISWRGTRD